MWIGFNKSFTKSFQNEVNQILNDNKLSLENMNIVAEDSIKKTKE